MSRKPCGRHVPAFIPGNTGGPCPYERAPGLQRCRWHWLMAQGPDVQRAWAEKRREDSVLVALGRERARVPQNEWPPGERWCAGCQSFVPMFYTSGSRCKACASVAAHASRVKSVYGISPEDYDDLFEFQGGRCAICRRPPRKLRLAVDHDHVSGSVRGLLCANNENGCNRAIVANLERGAGGGLEAAKRAVAYFERPPYAILMAQRGQERPQERPAPAPAPVRTPPPF